MIEGMEYRVSWPRKDRKERQYSIKRSHAAAHALFEKLVALGYKDVELHERKVQYDEWKEVTA